MRGQEGGREGAGRSPPLPQVGEGGTLRETAQSGTAPRSSGAPAAARDLNGEECERGGGHCPPTSIQVLRSLAGEGEVKDTGQTLMIPDVPCGCPVNWEGGGAALTFPLPRYSPTGGVGKFRKTGRNLKTLPR